MAPLVPVLGPPVQHQHRLALAAGLCDVHLQAAGLDGAVLDAVDVGEPWAMSEARVQDTFITPRLVA